MLKNRTTQIAIGVILLVLVVLGGYYLFAAKSTVKNQTDQSSQDAVQQLKPDQVGLTMSFSPDNKKVKFKLAKADGIKGIEYELTYEADSTKQEQSEGGEPRVQRGITGQADIKSGDSSYESEWLDLGSCSKNVCHYDTGVKSVGITLKLTKDDNKIYEVVDTADVE
jgi:hypothetical protein